MESWRTRFWIVFVCFLVSLAMNMSYAQSLRTTNDALREDGIALRRANQSLESAEALLTRCRDAMLYALRCGCFFPVPEPKPGATTNELIQWGAMRNLHDKIADLGRPSCDRR